MKKITVFVLAGNSEGVPEILAYDLSVTQAQYDNGDHYDLAEDKAEDAGYEVQGRFDEYDTAGQQFMGKAPLNGESVLCKKVASVMT